LRHVPPISKLDPPSNLPSRDSRGLVGQALLPVPAPCARYLNGQTRVSVLLNQHIAKPRRRLRGCAGVYTSETPDGFQTLQRPVKTYAFGERLMPATPHVEKHFNRYRCRSDVVIGMSDGLTVPFALAAGISGAVGAIVRALMRPHSVGPPRDSRKCAAGSIAMAWRLFGRQNRSRRPETAAGSGKMFFDVRGCWHQSFSESVSFNRTLKCLGIRPGFRKCSTPGDSLEASRGLAMCWFSRTDTLVCPFKYRHRAQDRQECLSY